MLTEERREVILSALAVHGTLTVSDLARVLSASEITVRRDLQALQDDGRLVRHRGGARLSRAAMDEPTTLEKTSVAADEKLAIADLAAEVVQDGEVVMICAGTTTHAFARRLLRRRLMVATNSILVADALSGARETDVLLIGGILRSGIRAAIGGDAERAVARLRFSTVVLSGNGLTAGNGLSTPNVHVASFDRAAVDAAERVVVLADHTKIGMDSMVQTVAPDRMDILITDSKADAAVLDALRVQGVDVRVVGSAKNAFDRVRG